MNEPSPLPQPWPRLRLDFYDTAVLLTRWEADGRLVSYPVSVHDVVSACTTVQLSSGLLPANTLFWKQQANQVMLGIYVPTRRWKVQTADCRYHLPMPPLVFAGCGLSYQVFAVKARPSNEAEPLYHAPCPNVYAHGGICRGEAPLCSPRNIQAALRLFLEGSLFNADLSRGKCQSYPEDVRRLWAALDGRKRFPLSELVSAQMTVSTLL